MSTTNGGIRLYKIQWSKNLVGLEGSGQQGVQVIGYRVIREIRRVA